ncbi:YeeE/YedE family protein [Chitiniphilus eburneus]|uniref:YeeE/YedE family protein n=1 Tax=Chitiniphilus eburneus TaxID=2571148 RepID=A0A4U0PYY8_9NEIS|nr:YeeE/YedE family protein [Chitiniphilus eburneus]TJZ73871.1 YeeE/YedE family protein [Chitiniphilus eburneus]
MTIDWTSFTPWSALLGGALIGIAASLLALGAGRIAGISGIVGGLVGGKAARWQLAFVAGLLIAPLGWLMLALMPAFVLEAGPGMQIVAGLLVGIGTRYANGCTSGHGVCGLSRLSLRSLVAVLAFMGAGFVTVYLLRHALIA